MEELSKLSDPKLIGPGVWYEKHTKSYDAKTPGQIDFFITDLKKTIDEFKCLECRGHAQKYLKTNPIERYRNEVDQNGQPIGMFKYMWEFHNFVNARLGKKFIPFDVAYNFYGNKDMVCTKECGSGHGAHGESGNTADTKSAPAIPAMPVLPSAGGDHLGTQLPFAPMSSARALYPTPTNNIFALMRSMVSSQPRQ
jgi:hypothetical protein